MLLEKSKVAENIRYILLNTIETKHGEVILNDRTQQFFQVEMNKVHKELNDFKNNFANMVVNQIINSEALEKTISKIVSSCISNNQNAIETKTDDIFIQNK